MAAEGSVPWIPISSHNGGLCHSASRRLGIPSDLVWSGAEWALGTLDITPSVVRKAAPFLSSRVGVGVSRAGTMGGVDVGGGLVLRYGGGALGKGGRLRGKREMRKQSGD